MLSLSFLGEKDKTDYEKHSDVFTEDGKAALLYSIEENLGVIIHLPLEHKNFATFAHKHSNEQVFIRPYYTSMRKHRVISQNNCASLPWKCLHTQVTWRNITDHGQSFAASEAPASSRPLLCCTLCTEQVTWPLPPPHALPKSLSCPRLHPWSERLLTQPRLYMHVTLAGTLHFLVHALHSLQ